MNEVNIPVENIEVEEYRSDLRELIDNLFRMVECYLTMSSEAARTAWLKPFCIEVSLVTLKLKSMHRRWQHYLPFQEVIDVRFKDTKEVVLSWLPMLGDDSVDVLYDCPMLELENGYLLDMMGYEVEPIKGGLSPDELRKAVDEYCKRVDKLLRKKLDDWESVAMSRLEQDMQELMAQDEKADAVRQLTIQAVKALADELEALEEFFWSELKEEHFIVLAARLLHRDCQDAIKDAQNMVRREHNSWPKKYVKERAMAMKTETKLRLINEGKGHLLKEYIDLDYPELVEDACFGQFLFKYRHKLTIEDVQLMVECCTMIDELNKYIDPTLAIKKRTQAAMGRELDAEEKTIVKRLIGFAEKAEWRGGATADSIKMGINRMLGVNYPLDKEMQPLSDILWKLLKVRKNCDAERSLMVTWLNIVGWCVNHRLLSGGSPALCSQFFPKCGPDDYKAIDKGKKEPAVAFQKVEPLLEKFMK